MPRLSEEVKLYIVQALACYDTPTQVCQGVKERFGVEVVRQHVSRYDPTVPGSDVSQKLRTVFDEARSAHRLNLREIPIAHQVYRLRTLQRTLERAEVQGNVPLVMRVLELAARETGGIFEAVHTSTMGRAERGRRGQRL